MKNNIIWGVIFVYLALPVFGVSQEKVEKAEAVDLGEYIGTYEVFPGTEFVISVSEGNLYLQAPGQGNNRLQANAPDNFSIAGANVRIVFVRNKKGNIAGLKLFQGEHETRARKKGVAKKSVAAQPKKEKNRGDILADIEIIKAQIKTYPGNAGFRLQYGELLYKAGEFWRARNIIKPLMKNKDLGEKALRLLAKLEHLLGEYQAAESHYKRLIKEKGQVMDKVALLFVYYQTNQFQKAAAIDFPAGVKLPNYDQMKAFQQPPYQLEWHNKQKVSMVPFLMTDPLPVLKLEVNGVEVVVIFDTGADQLILDNEVAAGMKLENVAGAMGSFGGGKKAEIGFGKVDRIKLGDVTLKNAPVTILPTKRFSSGFGDGKYTIGGVIGTAFMRQFLGTLDYKNGRLILRQRSRDNAQKLRDNLKGAIAAEIPFVLSATHLMMTKGSLNGKKRLTFFVDSGLASEACFASPIQTLNYTGIPIPKTKISKNSIGGGGGKFASGIFPIQSISLGNLKQTNVKGSYGALTPATYWNRGFIQDGLISHQFLRQYSSWTLDFDSMTYIFQK
jgi:hypothetical protein